MEAKIEYVIELLKNNYIWLGLAFLVSLVIAYFTRKNYLLNKRKEKREVEKYELDKKAFIINKEDREQAKKEQEQLNKPNFCHERAGKVNQERRIPLVNKEARAVNFSYNIIENRENISVTNKQYRKEYRTNESITLIFSFGDKYQLNPTVVVHLNYMDILGNSYFSYLLSLINFSSLSGFIKLSCSP